MAFRDSQITPLPIAIGGVGGSGTRVVAQILREAGLYIGSQLNDSLDNLWFSFLFVRKNILEIDQDEFEKRARIFRAAMGEQRNLSESEIRMLDQLAESHHPFFGPPGQMQTKIAESIILASTRRKENPFWGWKAPNTHMVLDKLNQHMEGLKYIHVARNGLDMAYSQNQNQLRIWGSLLFGEKYDITPVNSLKFWRWAHERILHLGSHMSENFLFVKFEDLCFEPGENIRKILTFAGIAHEDDTIDALAKLIQPPSSIDRHKKHELEIFPPEDIEFVRSLGFHISPRE